jgi:hypothetical protein
MQPTLGLEQMRVARYLVRNTFSKIRQPAALTLREGRCDGTRRAKGSKLARGAAEGPACCHGPTSPRIGRDNEPWVDKWRNRFMVF